jgi:hypothetical protein
MLFRISLWLSWCRSGSCWFSQLLALLSCLVAHSRFCDSYPRPFPQIKCHPHPLIFITKEVKWCVWNCHATLQIILVEYSWILETDWFANTSLTSWCMVSQEELIVSQPLAKFPVFMEPESSSPCCIIPLLECLEPFQFTPHIHNSFF